MLTLLAIVHVLVGLALVLFVLLQDPKGGAMGVFSGGSSSNSFFGASGASNFLTTTTKTLAIIFAFTCLALTYVTVNHSGSVMDNLAPASGTPENTLPSNEIAPGQQSIPGTNPALDKATDEKPAPSATKPTN